MSTTYGLEAMEIAGGEDIPLIGAQIIWALWDVTKGLERSGHVKANAQDGRIVIRVPALLRNFFEKVLKTGDLDAFCGSLVELLAKDALQDPSFAKPKLDAIGQTEFLEKILRGPEPMRIFFMDRYRFDMPTESDLDWEEFKYRIEVFQNAYQPKEVASPAESDDGSLPSQSQHDGGTYGGSCVATDKNSIDGSKPQTTLG